MARINIETSIYKDFGFQKFLIKIGCRKKAKGDLQELWELAQTYWFPDRKLIPEEKWNEAELSPYLVECGLAEKRKDGYYAKGSEEQFSWLFDLKAAGKASAEARKKKTPKKQQPSTAVEQPLNNRQGSSTSLLSSLNSPLSSHNSDLFGNASCAENSAAPALTPDIEPSLTKTEDGVKITGVSEFITLRRKLHLEIHGVEPIEGAQVNGILSRIAKSVPRAEMASVLEYFYRVPNNYYRTRGHDLKALQSDIAKILTEVRRKAPIIPDARADSFKKAVNAVSRDQELERMLKAKAGAS